MPFINIKTAAPAPSKEQKEQLIKEITEVAVRVLGKDPSRVMVMIETLDADEIGFGGVTVENIKKGLK